MSLSYNPHDNYLGAFRDYLNERGVVQGNRVPYGYLSWIQACYAMFSKPGDRILSRDEQGRFLNDLALTRAGWQVNQANDALRLYEYLVASRTQLCVSCILFRPRLFGRVLTDTGLLVGSEIAQDAAAAELGFEFYARALCAYLDDPADGDGVRATTALS